jgi:type II secretory pathway component PulK
MLVAILLVALGTIIAAAVAYENATAVRRGTATYAFDQAWLIA